MIRFPLAICVLAASWPVGVAHSTTCTCRARNVVAQLGQTVCVETPQGRRLARCDMVLNNTSWTFLSAPCPLVSARR